MTAATTRSPRHPGVSGTPAPTPDPSLTPTPAPTPAPMGFSRAFFALVCAQVISLMGDRIVCFALPLYVLNLTGSASLYSVVTASALIPYILLTPIGGVVADRVTRQRLMACLDVALAAICGAFLLLDGIVDAVALCICAMVGLYAVQAFYAPTVQASVPSLVGRSSLVRTTAITNQVSSLASLVGPFAGGVLYGFFGLEPILAVGAGAFVCSCAIVSAFVRTPRVEHAGQAARPEAGVTRQEGHSQKSPLAVALADLRDALRFLGKNPSLVRAILLCTGLNLVFAFVSVGLPVIVTQVLGLSNQLLGAAEACAGVGGLLGGALVALLGPRMRLRHAPIGVAVAALTFVPLAGVLLLGCEPLVAYAVLAACLVVAMTGAQAFTIQMISYVQLTTPDDLIGKVISLVVAACMCATPVGQLVWGVLLDAFRAQVGVLALVAGGLSLLLAAAVRVTFRGIADPAGVAGAGSERVEASR